MIDKLQILQFGAALDNVSLAPFVNILRARFKAFVRVMWKGETIANSKLLVVGINCWKIMFRNFHLKISSKNATFGGESPIWGKF